MNIFIDFETFSECDIRKAGAYRYANDPSTELLCFAWAIGDAPIALWKPGDPDPFRDIPSDAVWHAHNAQFERCIAKYVCPRYELSIPHEPERWRCTAAKCAALALPRSLEGAAKALELKLEKDMGGRAVMLKLSKPRKPSKLNPATRFTPEMVPEDYERLYSYCKLDVEVERAIDRVTPDLPDAEQAVWVLDQRINDRGIPVDTEAVELAIEAFERYRKTRRERFKELTGVSSPTKVNQTIEWLIDRGCNIADLTRASVAAALRRKNLPAEVREALEIRRELSLTSIQKFQAMSRMHIDGRVCGAHLYHGASTGRWSGRGVQFQNVPRGAFSDDENEITLKYLDCADWMFADVTDRLSGLLRKMVRFDDGLVVWDFAGIEVRVLAWIAEQKDLIAQLANGEDVYKNLAARIYVEQVENVTKAQRLVGKIATLGLGYGMGATKFYETCQAWGATDVEPELAETVVQTYRSVNDRIKAFWWAVNNAALGAVKKPGELYRAGRIQFKVVGRWLWLKLPNGRKLAYFDPKIGKGDYGQELTFMAVNSITNKWERMSSYGGKLVENLCQAIARDLLVEAMQRIESEGFEVLFHVHDEAIVRAPASEQERIESLAKIVPDWAKGCPIDVEGFAARRYRK